mgnify:CR=1 FL=1
MKNTFYYIASLLMAAVLTACGDEKIAERIGGNEDALTIKHKVGMNVVGRVTVDGSPREGVVVSDGITGHRQERRIPDAVERTPACLRLHSGRL